MFKRIFIPLRYTAIMWPFLGATLGRLAQKNTQTTGAKFQLISVFIMSCDANIRNPTVCIPAMVSSISEYVLSATAIIMTENLLLQDTNSKKSKSGSVNYWYYEQKKRFETR